MRGRIIEIVDHGTIVQVWIVTDEGQETPVNFDRRPFAAFYEDNEPLIGKTLDYHTDDEEPWVEIL